MERRLELNRRTLLLGFGSHLGKWVVRDQAYEARLYMGFECRQIDFHDLVEYFSGD